MFRCVLNLAGCKAGCGAEMSLYSHCNAAGRHKTIIVNNTSNNNDNITNGQRQTAVDIADDEFL